jgi:DNA polymerase I-like protein with 3'-5' exonuclease and polymerase domains
MQLIHTNEIDVYYITEDKDMSSVISFCKQYKELAVDTETKIDLSKLNPSALDPHSSNISLVQINSIDNKIPYILDFLSLSKEAKELFNQEVLMDKNIRKIIHFAQFDIKQFYSEFKTWPMNVWCTNVLMKSLSVCTGMKAGLFRGHGLKDMARDIFDINLDKTEAISEWGQRPLHINQIAYAGLDVGAPKNSKYCSLLLEGYHVFKDQLDILKQQIAYEIDQEAVLISAKMEYFGLSVDTIILNKMLSYAKEQTDIHRNYLVEELGFTVYQDTDLNEEGEWELFYIIPDKIKTLLNNNKGLVKYINEHLSKNSAQALSSLQAEEVKFYLDALETEVAEEESDSLNTADLDSIESKYNNIFLIKNLLKYKKFSKFATECQKYLTVINSNTSNIHAGFSSVGSGSGRMSSSGAVNLQQVSNVQAVIEITKDQF